MGEVLSKELLDTVEANSKELDKTIKDIIDPYCGELDEYMSFVRGILKDDEKPPTDLELDDMQMNISTLIYFASVGTEQMGVRDDLSRAAYKEAYNTARKLLGKGTVADKNTEAELQTMAEHVVNIIYSKAYKIMKAKVESAQDVLASIKKVSSRRIAEMELTKLTKN